MATQFNGTLSNPGIARLSIGVTGRDGKRAALEFKAENTAAPLVVQGPAQSQSEDAAALALAGWEKEGALWRDPLSGTLYFAEDADLVLWMRNVCDAIAAGEYVQYDSGKFIQARRVDGEHRTAHGAKPGPAICTRCHKYVTTDNYYPNQCACAR